MALNFPNSPNQGDLFTAPNGVQYRYDGSKWVVVPASNTTSNLALATAQLADQKADAAVLTANGADSKADSATVTSNSADAKATTALTTANTADANATTALTTANTAATEATTALATANGIDSKATTALADSATAVTTANAAITAVGTVAAYVPVANILGIPSSPATDDRVEVENSTGIESFYPLTGVPSGFVGDAGLSVRIAWDNVNTWTWVEYLVGDPDARYIEKTGGTISGALTVSGGVVGNVTGDLTGDVTGNASTATFATSAGNATTANSATTATTANSATTATTATTATNADNSAALGGIAKNSFLRSDANDSASGNLTLSGNNVVSGSIKFNDSKPAYFGSGSDASMFHNGSNLYTDLATGNYYIRSGTTTRFTFDRNGDFTSSNISGSTITASGRIIAGNTSATSVAYQFTGRANSGMGFPSNEQVALFAGGNKLFALKTNGTTYWGSSVDDSMTPGQDNTKNGVRLDSGGKFTHKRNSTNNSGACFLTGGNTGYFEVRNDGDCLNTNGKYEQVSDGRFKENVVDANSQWEDIKALRWVNYNFKTETDLPSHTQIGLVAQETEAVCPGLISENEIENMPIAPELKSEIGETYKSVAYSVVAMKAAAALKEALIRIEQLETRLAAVESLLP